MNEKKFSKFRKRLDKFSQLVNQNISKEFIEFIDESKTKELIYFQLKCKDLSEADKIINPERVMQFLDNEIHRRIQNRIISISKISLIVSFAAISISLWFK